LPDRLVAIARAVSGSRLAAAADSLRWSPAGEIVVGEVEPVRGIGEERVVDGGGGVADVGVELAVPLAYPGQDFAQAGEEWGEAVGGALSR
jgi:hypothetical protein